MTPKIARTRAVVVGVERYAAGSDWNLSGPALDACRFARWLVDRGVPTENIDLLVTPLDENSSETKRLAARSCLFPANQHTVRDALTTKLISTSSDLLIIYWGGHGVLDDAESRRLFYADASEKDKRNLNLTSLLSALRSSSYATHRRQLVVVDACMTLAQDRRWMTSLPDETYAVGHLEPDRDQHVLFAASPGQVAVNDTWERTGLFSTEFRSALDQLPRDVWPPDPVHIRDLVDRKFQKLRTQGRTEQVPSHMWFRSRSTDDVLIFTSSPTDPGATAKTAGCLVLNPEEVDELQGILNGAKVPKLLAALYRDATRNVVGMPPCPAELTTVVEALRGAVSARPLFEFLVRFSGSSDKVTRLHLWRWLRRTAPKWGVDVGVLTALDRQLHPTVLLLQVEPDLLEPAFQVTVWSYVGGDGWQATTSSEPWTWDRIGDELSVLLREIVAADGLRPLIEFRVPNSMLQEGVENLLVDLSAGEYPVGLLCPVVIRGLDRPLRTPLLAQKWQDFEQCGTTYAPGAVCLLDAASEDELPSDALCVGVFNGPGASPETLETVLAAAIDAEIPLVLWHRTNDFRRADESALDSIVRGRALHDLPDVVHQQRLAAHNSAAPIDHPGRDLVLLRDDPNRTPPVIRWVPPR